MDIMGKATGAACLAVIALTVADHYLNSGRYTEAIILVLRQMRYSFG